MRLAGRGVRGGAERMTGDLIIIVALLACFGLALYFFLF
jgi:hypothetical protein